MKLDKTILVDHSSDDQCLTEINYRNLITKAKQNFEFTEPRSSRGFLIETSKYYY